MEDSKGGTRERGPSMSYLGHLAELRKRLFRAVIALLLASGASFAFSETVSDFLMRPSQGLAFVYLSPPDLFMTYVRLSLAVGLAVSLPFIVYQIWMFVSPALSRKEKRAIFFSLIGGALLFAGGVAFAFYVIIPFSLRFFLSYESARIAPMLSITEYFRFILNIALSFGVAFELPILAGLLGSLGILSPEALKKGRRFAIILIFVVAAILTPPDVISQVLLACPMLALYELSIIILKRQSARREKRGALVNA